MKSIFLAWSILLLLSGCSEDSGCKSDEECGEGFECKEGICKQKLDPDRDMVTVPAGAFMMGCNDTVDVDCDPDESPYHEINLSGYKIDKLEVSQGQYDACVGAGACTDPAADANCRWDPGTRASLPVVCVTWVQASEYCAFKGRRLPTEAEWEKAARGEAGRIYPWGDTAPSCMQANFGDCHTDAQPVGSNPEGASPYGALDMAGNVYEWVNDYYDEAYYASSPADDPQGPSTGTHRVMRGGSWGYEAKLSRASNRGANEQDVYRFPLGFRCAKSAE